MLTGVEILLERMKTNPEEFIEGGMSKWARVMDTAWAILAEDERDALQAGMIEAKREHFNGEVMRVLAQGHDEIENNLVPHSAIVSKKSMIAQTTQLLNNEFDKAYAGSSTKVFQTIIVMVAVYVVKFNRCWFSIPFTYTTALTLMLFETFCD